MTKISNDSSPIVHVPDSNNLQLSKPLPLRNNRVNILGSGVKGETDEQPTSTDKKGKLQQNKYTETREKIARFLDVTLLISNASTLANVYKNRKIYRNGRDVYFLLGAFGVSIMLQSIAAITFMIVKYYTDQMDKIQNAQDAIINFKMEAKIPDVKSEIFEIDGIGRWHYSSHHGDYDNIFHQMEELSYKNYRRRRFYKHVGHVCVFFVLILNILGGAFFNVLETVNLP